VNVAAAVLVEARLAGRSAWAGGRARRGIVPLVLALLVAAVLGASFTAMFRALDAAAGGTVLAWVYTLALVAMVAGDLHVLASAAIAAPDLELLLAAPLGSRRIFALKIVETLPRTLLPVLAVTLPAASAYAHVHRGSGVAALVVGPLALWAVPLGVGSALAIPLARLTPTKRWRESLAVFATFAFVAGWLASAFWVPRLAGSGPLAEPELGASLRALPAPPPWSPATWAAQALAATGERALEATLLCLLASAVSLALAFASAGRLLAELHGHALEHAGGAAGGPARGAASGTRLRSRRAPTLAAAFLRRDAALIERDWPVVLDALASLALWSLLPLAVLPLAPIPRLELARAMLIALSVSLGLDVAARALPLERASLAWARLSPVGGARWLRLRALGVAIVCGAVLAAAIAIVSGALGLRGGAALDVAAFGVGSCATAAATGMLLGAWLGDPEWTDARAMLGLGGRAVSAAALLAQAAAWLALSHRLAPRADAVAAAPAALLLTLLASAALATATLVLAARVGATREITSR